MNGNGTTDMARLQKKAAQCRQLAQQALSDGIAIELGKLADDYDEQVARLELSDADHMRVRVR